MISKTFANSKKHSEKVFHSPKNSKFFGNTGRSGNWKTHSESGRRKRSNLPACKVGKNESFRKIRNARLLNNSCAQQTFSMYEMWSSVKISNAFGRDLRLLRPLLKDFTERILHNSIVGQIILSLD